MLKGKSYKQEKSNAPGIYGQIISGFSVFIVAKFP